MELTIEEFIELLENKIKAYNVQANEILLKINKFNSLKQFKKNYIDDENKTFVKFEINTYNQLQALLGSDQDLEFIHEIESLKTRFPLNYFTNFTSYHECQTRVIAKLDKLIQTFHQETPSINEFINQNQKMIIAISETLKTLNANKPITDINEFAKILKYLNLSDEKFREALILTIDYNNKVLNINELKPSETKRENKTEKPLLDEETQHSKENHEQMTKEEIESSILNGAPYISASEIWTQLELLDYDLDVIEKLAETLPPNKIKELLYILKEDLEVYCTFSNETNNKDYIMALEYRLKLKKIKEILAKSLNKSKSETQTVETEKNNKEIILLFSGFNNGLGNSEIEADIKNLKKDQATYNKTKALLEELHEGKRDNDDTYTGKIKKLRKKKGWGIRIVYLHLVDNVYIVVKCFEKHDQNKKKHLESIRKCQNKWVDDSGRFTNLSKNLITSLKDPALGPEIIARNEEIYNNIINSLTKKTNQNEGRHI